MERNPSDSEPDAGADNAPAADSSVCTSVVSTIEAVFDDLQKRFATICSDCGDFVVAPGGNRALIACGNRYLAYRLLPLSESAADGENQAAPAMALELYAVSTFGNRVPLPSEYLRWQHRILTVTAVRQNDELRWRYLVPNAYQHWARRNASSNPAAVELATEEVVRRAAILLALTPIFPPDRIAVSRALTM